MDTPSYCFTVFTPTFNRRHTLPGVYDSLRAQTFRDFEWLIVDDGSIDGTEELVGSWQRHEPAFPIRYIHQPNQGKHVAINRGVREARGEMFLILDSDDSCVPETLAVFRRHWQSIPAAERERFSTITALCRHEDGEPCGLDFPAPIIDAATPAEQMRLKRAAERWGVNRTEVLRQFPFPEIAGEKFIAEGIVWTRMSLVYKTRFINERLRVFRRQDDGLSAFSRRLRMSNAAGARLGYQEALRAGLPFFCRLRDAVNYCRFSFHAGVGWKRLLHESRPAPPAAVLILAPAGLLAYWVDRVQYPRPRKTSAARS